MKKIQISVKTLLVTTALFGATSIVTAQNVGINAAGTAPDASAALDVSASDKGMLVPRVALTATTDVATITTPATSLLVYNTATAGDVTPGYYYFDGTIWQRMVSGTIVGTDDQNITGSGLSGTTLTIGIEGGINETVDLSSLQDGTGTDSQTLSLTGSTLSISGGNSVAIPGNIPAGAIMAFNLATCPTGWAAADGTGTTPDLRGEFVRGLDDGRGVDAGRTLASAQSGDIQAHSHTVNPPSATTNSAGAHTHSVDPPNTSTTTNGAHSHGSSHGNFLAGGTINGNNGTGNMSGNGPFPSGGAWGGIGVSGITSAGAHNHTVNIAAFNSASAGSHTHTVDIPVFNSGTDGGAETRPRNVAFLYCIKQ